MKLFMVDSENINNYEFIKKYNLTIEDTIVIFKSKNSQNVSLDTALLFSECLATIQHVDCVVGVPNALDFRMIAEASFRLGQNSELEIYLVSNDKAFDIVRQHLNELLKRMDTLKKNNTKVFIEKPSRKIIIEKPSRKIIEKEKQPLEQIADTAHKATIRQLVVKWKLSNDIVEILNTLASQNKIGGKPLNDLHNKLYANLGEKGKKVYKEIKKTLN